MKTVHLAGDSIMRGYALGAFEPQATQPLYNMRSPWSVAQLVLEDNGAPLQCSHLRNMAVNDSLTPERFTDLIADGVIKAGDFVVLEDAGDHGSDPDAYEAMLGAVLAPFANTGIKVITMTMFDYSPAPSNSQWDKLFNGRSHNDAILAATASAQQAGVEATCLDMNTKMDAWKSYCQGQHLLSVMLSDGIHPNHWGTARMAGLIIQAVDGLQFLQEVRRLENVVAQAPNDAYAGSNSQYWSESVAKSYAKQAIFNT